MDGWNTSVLLGLPIFRGYVKLREGNVYLATFTSYGGKQIGLEKVPWLKCLWHWVLLRFPRFKRLCWEIPVTSCPGRHHTPNHLLATRSRSTYYVPSPSHRKECSHFSLPTYWRRETAQTQTGLDTSGCVDHSSMNFVDQMPTRRSTTSSKTSTPNWFSPDTICERST